MARSAHLSSGPASSRHASRSSLFSAGSVIAERYRLEKPIGTGGMATIWEATHVALNRAVAVKFIDIAGPNTPKLRERFLREARVAAAVRHRNVVDIVDFGTAADGSPFMAMELLVGQPLSSRISSAEPVSVPETVRIMAGVLSGLAAVHDAGIVHRDLKPENVFLVRDADGVFPKLLDFGVSRALDPLGDLQSVLPTVENAIVGTPQYMSPEQARGLRNLDHRSDLWSAGVMIYELLTGTLPFDSDAVGDVLIQIATADPPPLVTLRPDLEGPLEQLVMRALRRKPAERFESAREMRAALLSAAAKTATALRTRPSHETHPTRSDAPPVHPGELLDAVGDAYEPGDSGMLDLFDIAGEEPSASGTRPIPIPLPAPPKVPSFGDGKDAERAFFSESSEVASAAPKASSRRWLVVAAAVLVVGLGAGAGAWWLTAEPELRATELPPLEAGEPAVPALAAPSTIAIQLRGVPEGASVTVDGAARALPLTLERDEASHRIEVRDADGRTWATTHVASADGAYEVAFAPAEIEAEPEPEPPRTRRPRRPRRGSARPARSDGLLRDPGF